MAKRLTKQAREAKDNEELQNYKPKFQKIASKISLYTGIIVFLIGLYLLFTNSSSSGIISGGRRGGSSISSITGGGAVFCSCCLFIFYIANKTLHKK
jgi:hypothetical protein